MRIFSIYTAIILWIVAATFSQAQETDRENHPSAEELTEMKDQIVQEEKEALKIKIDNINARLQSQAITKSEAETLKEEAAERHALNIENRTAIMDNELALIKRNGIDSTKMRGSISIGLGNKDADNARVWGVQVKESSAKKRIKYDSRTTSGAVFAFGLNNVITKGESLEDSDFQIGGSRFFEMGWVWKTRVFKESNWLRVKYGISYQLNGLKPTDNRYFVDMGEQTELQPYPMNLKKSKLRMDHLVVPVHFEFGPSKKVEHKDYFRYTTNNQFKIGIGGYGGINVSTRQKLKFKEDGERKKEKIIANYNTNNFIYGVSGYIGWGAGSIYAKYDLNTIFKNNAVDQRNISLGLRLDFD